MDDHLAGQFYWAAEFQKPEWINGGKIDFGIGINPSFLKNQIWHLMNLALGRNLRDLKQNAGRRFNLNQAGRLLRRIHDSPGMCHPFSFAELSAFGRKNFEALQAPPGRRQIDHKTTEHKPDKKE